LFLKDNASAPFHAGSGAEPKAAVLPPCMKDGRTCNDTVPHTYTAGIIGAVLAFLLRQRELGPHGHGLETITAG